MPQYLILGSDPSTPGALEKRMEVRPRHLALVKKLKESKNFIFGGAQLNQEEQMKGSALVLEFVNEEELQNYLAIEPYIVEGVWEKYEVIPFRLANV